MPDDHDRFRIPTQNELDILQRLISELGPARDALTAQLNQVEVSPYDENGSLELRVHHGCPLAPIT